MTESLNRRAGCLELEELAAYLDGGLTAARRDEIEAHVVACERCYDLLAEVTGALAEARGERELTDVAGGSSRGSWLYAAASIAAVLALGVWARPYFDADLRLRRDVQTVLTAGSERPFEVRLSGETAWRPVAAAMRGDALVDRLPGEARIALVRIDESLADGRTAARLVGYGRAQLAAGRVERGIAALEEAVALDGGTADVWADLAAGYIVRSQTPERAGDLPRALQAVDRAVSLDGARAEYHFNRAIVLEKLNLRPQAIQAWQKYLAADPASPWASEARQRLARLEQAEPRSDAGTLRDELLQCVLPVWAANVLSGQPVDRGLADARALAAALGATTADAYANDVVEAMASVAGQRQQAPVLRAIVAYGNGRAAYAQQQFELASRHLTESRAALERARHPLALSAAVYSALVEYRRKHYEQAHALLEPLVEPAAARRYPSIVGRVHWTRGLMWLLEGRNRESAAAYRAAIEALNVAGEDANAAFVVGLLATTYDRLGDPVRMWQARVRALQGSTREGTLLRAANEARREGWPRAARDFAAAALDSARASGSRPLIIDALRCQAVIESELGENALAESLLAEARRELDGLSADAKDRLNAEVDLATAIVAVRGGDAGNGLEAATRVLGYFTSTTPPTEERLPEILLTRARLARRLGRSDQARADLSQGIEIYRRMRQFASPGVDQATLADVARRLTDEFVTIVAPENEGAAFHEAERVRAWDLAKGDGDEVITLAAARELVPEGAVIASYVVGDSTTHVWVIREGRSSLTRIPAGRQRLSEMVVALEASGSSTAARTLSDLLLSPLRTMLEPGDIVAIVGDGPLHQVAFGALDLSAGGYLVEGHPVLAAPSVSYLLKGATPLHPGSSLLAIGNPAFTRAAWPELADLPGAALEATALARKRPRAVHLEGEAATRSAILRHIDGATVVHFAGHAVVNEFTAADSALVLAGRDRLTAGEIREMRLDHVNLIVLASCESARGFQPRSEGPMGLARAFHAAGVSNVVSSLRPVDDRRSRAFFESFHAAVSQGLDPARALQRAQVEAIAADRTRAAARHWSSYVLTGSLPSPVQ